MNHWPYARRRICRSRLPPLGEGAYRDSEAGRGFNTLLLITRYFRENGRTCCHQRRGQSIDPLETRSDQTTAGAVSLGIGVEHRSDVLSRNWVQSAFELMK